MWYTSIPKKNGFLITDGLIRNTEDSNKHIKANSDLIKD